MNDNIFDKVIQVISLLDEIEETSKNLGKCLSEQDKKITDLRHLVEFETLDASQCWYFVKKLQRICKKRREVKKQMSFYNTFKEQVDGLKKIENRKMLKNNMYKLNKRLDYSYTPNLYSESDLINLKILKGVENDERDNKSESE